MEWVGPVGKPTLVKTTRARRVASSRFCSSDRCSRFSVRTATAMPCIARFSLISLGVCMLERESPPRQVTQVTRGEQARTQLAPGPAPVDKSRRMQGHESQCEMHSRNYFKPIRTVNPILSQAETIEQDCELRKKTKVSICGV